MVGYFTSLGAIMLVLMNSERLIRMTDGVHAQLVRGNGPPSPPPTTTPRVLPALQPPRATSATDARVYAVQMKGKALGDEAKKMSSH
jgi:hypothetical protein